ncbi:restriction endonuclease subunit S, partial [Thiolapillus sp.]|uniref:restriction endonuclease subunit S n=1 Tax=Thiolapillus sp. TaxID=2017437 RepID=UPI003AF7FA34
SIARAIFKSWFVDFDPVKAKMEGKQPEGMTEEIAALFPDRLVDSELGMIPEGWDTIVLSEIVDIHSGGTPKTKVSEYWNGTIPWYSVVDAPNDGEVFVVTTSKSITDMGLNNSSTKILPIGSTIISARGTVGKLAVTCSKITMNQSCYALKGLYGDFFTYYTISEEVDWLKQNAHGAVFDTITRATFKEISIVLPNTEIIRMYESLVLPLMERIKVLLYESNTLAELRDTLLPRLISGNIRVNQPEDAAE